MVQRNGTAEFVKGFGIARLDVGVLAPDCAVTAKEIDGSGFLGAIVILQAIDTACGAVFELCSHGKRIAVAAQIQTGAELIVRTGI